ncbi:MAG: FG-GAP-like repeat-containing protein [Actinomycetota bacterium]|nr:FG-GAP-like repeat-containing protein [Actinomycetota bacterium]
MVFVLLPLATGSGLAADPDPEVVFPVAGENHYSDTFGACRGSGCSRSHEGIDIMAAKMTPVVAAASGWVRYVNWSWTPDDLNPERCCTLAIRHDDGWESWYIHMNNDTPGTDDGLGWGLLEWVVPGVRVEAGQHVGWVGDSGNAESVSPHVHFELHDPSGTVVNPYPFLQDAQSPEGLSYGASERRGCDFDGNGIDDFAVGSPSTEVGGSVWISYGGSSSAGGVVQQVTQNSDGVPGVAELGDALGSSVACGDVNGDGFDDLAVGASGEDIGSRADAGYVTVIHGSEDGLQLTSSYGFSQATAGVAGGAEADDRLGASIALGDFDNDGYADIAVGIPGEDVGSRVDAGAVQVFYGSAVGITASRDKFYSQSTSGVAGAGEAGDEVGFSLAAGDLNGDGIDDLIVGAPGEDVGMRVDAGAINVLFGSQTGLSTTDSRVITQASPGIAGGAEAGDRFGAAVTAGDLNDDGYDDVAVGVPGEAIGSLDAAGAVNVIYGSPSGPSSSGDQFWSQASAGVNGAAESGDAFGAAVISVDINGDGYDDLVIGVPREDLGAVADTGIVAFMFGSEAGLTADGDTTWSEPGFDTNHQLGSGVEAGDVDGDGIFDILAVIVGSGRVVVRVGGAGLVVHLDLGSAFAEQIAG